MDRNNGIFNRCRVYERLCCGSDDIDRASRFVVDVTTILFTTISIIELNQSGSIAQIRINTMPWTKYEQNVRACVRVR